MFGYNGCIVGWATVGSTMTAGALLGKFAAGAAVVIRAGGAGVGADTNMAGWELLRGFTLGGLIAFCFSLIQAIRSAVLVPEPFKAAYSL